MGLEPTTLCLEGRCSTRLSYPRSQHRSQSYVAAGASTEPSASAGAIIQLRAPGWRQ